jgi:hypothetical protein
MKYWIKRTCGHEEQIEVFGKVSDVIKREENKVCRKCYIEGRKAAIKKVAAETGLPIEVLEKIFMVFDAEQYLKQAEAHADTLKASPDKTNKHKNAYIAVVNLGKTAQKYGL